jgi:hypothetical protein
VKVQTFEPIRNNRHWQGRLTAGPAETITLDLNAVKQNSKSRKTGVSTVEIALATSRRRNWCRRFKGSRYPTLGQKQERGEGGAPPRFKDS